MAVKYLLNFTEKYSTLISFSFVIIERFFNINYLLMASNSKSKASTSSSSSGNSEGGQARKRNYPIFEQHNQNEPKRGKNDDGDDENGDGEDQTKGPLKIWSWNVAGLRGCVKVS
jgi:hypothetical protein